MPIEFNNFKNSLKSLGSRIVAIRNLAKNFEGFEAFVGSFRKPVLPVVGFTGQVRSFRYAAIQLVFVRQIHPLTL